MQVTCIKCNHVNPNATGSAHDACPKCGVIYAKAQQAMAPAVRRPVANSKLEHSPNQFIEELREASIDPTFRSVISLGYVLGLVLAVLLALGGIVADVAPPTASMHKSSVSFSLSSGRSGSVAGVPRP